MRRTNGSGASSRQQWTGAQGRVGSAAAKYMSVTGRRSGAGRPGRLPRGRSGSLSQFWTVEHPGGIFETARIAAVLADMLHRPIRTK